MKSLRLTTACFSLVALLPAQAGFARDAAELATGDWRASRKFAPRGFNESLVDERLSSNLRQRFDDQTRSYEWRERFSLTSLQDEQSRVEQSSSFAMTAFSEVQAAHVERGIRKVTATRKGQSVTDASQASVAVAGAAAALYLGLPIRLKASGSTELTLRSRAYEGTGSLELRSPSGVTAVTFASNASDGSRAPGSVLQGERVGFQASRPLHVADLTSGLTYGSTSGLMTASLSRPLFPNMAIVADSSKPIGDQAPTEKPAQERLAVLYRLSF
jgi:hypothetical protein